MKQYYSRTHATRTLATTVSKNVRSLRQQQQLTQANLAHKAGVTVETVARLERVVRGRVSANINPSLSTLVSIAHALNVPADALLRGKAARAEAP
jgi:transcriptional regulator with XRE-family HTH domain